MRLRKLNKFEKEFISQRREELAKTTFIIFFTIDSIKPELKIIADNCMAI